MQQTLNAAVAPAGAAAAANKGTNGLEYEKPATSKRNKAEQCKEVVI